MNLMSKFFNNTRKPEGFLGKMMVNGMNGGGHAALAEWGLSFVIISKNDSVLDCGCGGGANVKRLLAKCDNAYGIDYRLAYYLSEINVLHPFREGNGRAQRLFIEYLADHAGYKVDFSDVTADEIIIASAESFARDYDKINEMFERITSKK